MNRKTSNKTADSSAKGNRLALKVTPSAGRNEISGYKNGLLHVKVAAPPEKGKANKELIGFLSEKLGIKKSSITIVRGETGRNKIIDIEGMNLEEVLKRLLE